MAYLVIFPIGRVARRAASASAIVGILTLLTGCGTPGRDGPFGGFQASEPATWLPKFDTANPVPAPVPATADRTPAPRTKTVAKKRPKSVTVPRPRPAPLAPASVAPAPETAPADDTQHGRPAFKWRRSDDDMRQNFVTPPDAPAAVQIVPAPVETAPPVAQAPAPAPDRAGVAERFRKSVLKRREADPASDAVWPSPRSGALPHASDDKE